MKKRLIALALVAIAALSACTIGPTQESKDAEVVASQQEHYAAAQPIPFFDFSQDRDTLIQIYKAKNEARQTWAVIQSQGTGAPLYACPSIGYALAADTQLTNGLQLQYRRFFQEGSGSTWVDGVVEQAEPNGLFSSKNTDGTYVLCIRPNGDVVPVYTEQKVTTFPYEVAIRDGVIVDVAGAKSTITIDIKPAP